MKTAHEHLQAHCGPTFTGAVARVEVAGKLRWERAYGATRDDDRAQPVFLDTYFDFASLTKLFVATAALLAVQEHRCSLDQTLTGVFPEWRNTPHEAITLRALLAHTSGINSGADYRQLLGSNVVTYALTRDLVETPGKAVIYSDLGFIALGVLLERIHQRSLDVIVEPICDDMTYRPRATFWPAIPATEDDGWRGRVQGYVHDEKAYLMGGTAGHAGLFGTARAAAQIGEIFLGALHGRRSTVSSELAKAATSEQAYDPVLRRGLGWALKTSDENSCGRAFSSQTFGHTGFVGTCIWVDPVRDVNAVLLTNSVYFGRKDIRDVRAAFYDAVVEDLGMR